MVQKEHVIIPLFGGGRALIVHRDGKIESKSCRGGKIRELTPKRNNSGYMMIGITENNVRCHISVHRLMAQCFIPNPENKPQVNHKNGIKTDNSLENLEWCTRKENAEHAVNNELYQSLHVIRRSKTAGDVIRFRSMREAERKTGICRRTLYDYCYGICKQPKDYTWNFEE